MMADPYDLQRFVDAQEAVYEDVVAELRAGLKRSHWMWFVFPQLRELGRSATAIHFGIRSRDEAIAYLEHDVLGPRLRRCAQLAAGSGAVTAQALMGAVDALKLRSSMTLFAEVTDDSREFVAVLEKFYDGEPDPLTVEILGSP